jgi:hypothetical protein
MVPPCRLTAVAWRYEVAQGAAAGMPIFTRSTSRGTEDAIDAAGRKRRRVRVSDRNR